MIRRAITGTGQSRAFIATYDTTIVSGTSSASDTVRIPLFSNDLLYVKWGDGSEEWVPQNNGQIEHTYAVGGVYDVEIYNKFEPRYTDDESKDKNKLTEIKQWGDSSIGYQSYYGCSNLALVSATDVPRVGDNCTATFQGCSSLVSMDVSNWDVSGVTNMRTMFRGTAITTLDVSNWDVSSVTDMGLMFHSCSQLTTLDVSNWDVSSVTDMRNMFQNCNVLTTLDVSNWNTSNVQDMRATFRNCQGLTDLPVQNWNIENVTDFVSFALGVTIPTITYDQILNNWSGQNVNSSLDVHFGSSQYSLTGQVGRDDLTTNHLWTITDGGLAP